MRNRQLSVAAGLVAVLGLGVTACGSDAADAGGAKAPASSSPQAVPANSPAAGQGSAPTSGKAGAAPGGRKCTAADLKAAVAGGSGAQSPDAPGAEEIELTNKSGAVCTMKGYPGVDLVGDRGTWNLPRFQGAQAEQVTLQPGGKAYVAIDYLPFAGGGAVEFKVQKIVLTPPDDTSQLTVQWSGANPQDQSGATHPGTYVRPVSAKR
ncbi:DUF4232 domain-containing protein [Kitasatospora griseola]|uniref:DUF4232 domain-containing protein n=1 Tax=Kitasatospora griseola TaxID=2064 RepID=UPI0036637BB8